MRYRIIYAVTVLLLAIPRFTLSQSPATRQIAATGQEQEMPSWMRRGLPGEGHAALNPLIGAWRVEMSIHATFGRSPSAPPIVSTDLVCRREWVAGGRYIEDITEGTAVGGRYWRKGWLGYSTMDRRYEWVTIDAVNSTMMSYVSTKGSGTKMPISMRGVFTDQGVAGEESVGKSVAMRTVISIENPDRHIVELYFTPPGKTERLATRMVYTRMR